MATIPTILPKSGSVAIYMLHSTPNCNTRGGGDRFSGVMTFAYRPGSGDVRGTSLMQAVELVRNRETKAPAPDENAYIFERTREHGLVLSKSGNFRNVLRMVPPLCLSMDDVEPVLSAYDRSFRDLMDRLSG